jgi:hypothetical protein
VFYHPELRFQMPVAPGWKLDNEHAAVVMAEPNGRAMMGLRLAPGSRARDAAVQFAQESKVQVVNSGDTQVNGLPATVIIGQGNTDEGAVGVWDAFIEMDGKVYSLLGYAPQPVFDQMRPTFESVAAGFGPLRDERVAALQPARVRLVRADRNAPFASFVPTSLPPHLTAEELAIMNQVTLNDQIPQGRTLKVPDSTGQPPVGAPITTQPTAYPPPNQPQPYPPATSYPQPTYPPSSSPYPGQQYPDQRYPQPSTYPNYPPSSGYPQNYPPQSYPPQSGYPQPYPPQSGTNYPPQAPTNYPSTSYPPQGNYPQFPQPPANNDAGRTPPQQQPTWPR